ncbi:cupin domain-containing protein [Ktedonosporobacter rubrisoli]|uniref:Cupin domain-containing protein n=1 Tax=Ktedonosporobacter rubrisoli TaxID=2509675 RepID=A0A4P6JXS0_KTERU|nr:cupin domain-containing protein [Ktedonosporobacter rubrisoli]QBD79816.1 cupin domain-containing protein [Ktedonosporobacter rubrisoli]
MSQIRRCVIGTGADGQSYTQFDNDAPVGMKLGKTGAVGLLWATQEMPIKNTGNDDPALGPFQPLPGPGGTTFVFAMFPPESEMGILEDMKASARKSGVEASFENPQKHPGMHKTKTLDYCVILEGEVWLLTDKDEILLKAGDTVVCRGANHHWNNRTTVPCVAIVVSISAELPEFP